MKATKIFLCLVLIGSSVVDFSLYAQDYKSNTRKGNKLYEEKKYNDAEVLYRKALASDSTFYKAQYNLGDALYKEKEKLELQLAEMKQRHKEKEKENREMESNKKEFIILKEREIKDAIYYMTKEKVRAKITNTGIRPDGRKVAAKPLTSNISGAPNTDIIEVFDLE